MRSASHPHETARLLEIVTLLTFIFAFLPAGIFGCQWQEGGDRRATPDCLH